MARRVNTKFLILLVTILVLIVAGVFGIVYGIHVYQNNPARLVASAKQALQAGHIDVGIARYQRAVLVCNTHHLPQTADLLVKLGDVYYRYTAQHPRRFWKAIGRWRGAVQIDPSLLAARLRLLNAYDQMARWHITGTGTATLLAGAAKHVIRLDPKNARAWRLYGQGQLMQLAGVAGVSNARYVKVARDLQRACRLAPSSIKAHAALAELFLEEAQTKLRQRVIGPRRAAVLRQRATGIMDSILKKYPHNAQGWAALAGIHQSLPKGQAAATRAINRALTLAPKSPRVLTIYIRLLMAQNASVPVVAGVWKKLIALEPGKMLNYLELGDFYLHQQRPDQAVIYLEQSLEHLAGGKGITPLVNQSLLRPRANEQLTRAYLELAEMVPAGSPQEKSYLAKAAKYLAWIARRAPESPWVYVYRGRLRLDRGRLSSALRWLKRGATILSPSNSAEANLWFLDKQLQSRVYQLRGQSGSALKQLNSIDQYLPGNPAIMLDRAALLLKPDPTAALRTADQVLKVQPGNPRATIIKAEALAEMNRLADLETVLTHVNTAKNLSLALLKTRLNLLQRRYSKAWSTISPWLKQMPADPRVVMLGYAALAGLNQRTQAAQVVDRAVQASPDNMEFVLLSDRLHKPGAALPQVKISSLSGNVVQLVVPGVPARQTRRTQLAAIGKISDPLRRNLILARFYLGAGQFTQANAAAAQAAKISPANPEVVSTQFQLALIQKNFKSASLIAAKAAALNIDGRGGALFQARLDLARGDPAAAVGTLRPVRRKHPNNAVLQAYYGMALLASGNIQTGISDLKGALQSKPDDLIVLKTLIPYYLSQPGPQALAQARDLINQGMAYYPLDAQFKSWHYTLADLYGPPGPEITRRRAILKNDPNNIHNVRRLALLYARSKDLPRAIALLEKTLRANPNHIKMTQELGSLYLADHTPLKAQALYEKLAENAKPSIAFLGRLLLGDFYQSQNSLSQAAQLYESALKVQPTGRTVVQRRLGDMFFKYGRFKKALKYYALLYKARPGHRTVLLRYVETLIRAGRPAQGLAILNRTILAKNPHDEEALVLKGFALLRQRKLPAALVALNAALAVNPHDTHALYDRATVLAETPGGNLEHAIGDLVTLLGLAPDNVPARLLLANLYIRTNHDAEAVHEYVRTLAISPDYPMARVGYAQLLLALSTQYLRLPPSDQSEYAATLRTIRPLSRLRLLLAQSIRRYPKDPEWLVLQGRLDMLQGRRRHALAVERRAYRLANRGSLAALAYLDSLLSLKQYATAVHVAGEAIAITPGEVGLYVARGTAYAGLGKFAAGTVDFVHALKLTLSDPAIFLDIVNRYTTTMKGKQGATIALAGLRGLANRHPGDGALINAALAMVEFSHHRLPEALALTEKALANKPAGMVRLYALRLAALANYESGRYIQAKTNYLALLKLDPNNPDLLNNLAYLLAVKLKDPRAALAFAQKANTLAAKLQGGGAYTYNASILDTLGWVRFLNGDTSGAYEALRRSIHHAPPTTAYYHLARVLVAEKRPREARRVLQAGIVAARRSKDLIVEREEESLLKKLKGQAR